MTESDRQEWLKAAWIALDGIPLDLLKLGCLGARYCDHPAKIVPAILREVEDMWKRRRANRSDVMDAIAKMEAPPASQEPRCTAEQAAEILRKEGITLESEGRNADYIPVDQRKAPDADWYRAHGVDPAQEEAA
jgi:hypothetical protein